MQLSSQLAEAASADQVVEYLRERADQATRTAREYDAIAKRARGLERESALRTAAEAKGEANAYRDAARAVMKGP